MSRIKLIEFNSSWLQKADACGNLISEWCKKNTDTHVMCTLCMKIVKFSEKGFQAIFQHSTTNIHKKNALSQSDPLQTTMGNANLDIISKKDNAYKSELLWVMKMVMSKYSVASSDGVTEIFKAAFGKGVPEAFCLSPQKVKYLITDALGPYFRQKILSDAKESYYSLLYDETTNSEGKKELQIACRYWSEINSKVVTSHLETFFLGHAYAETIVENITRALDNANLKYDKLLMIGSDGPNVNKKVFRLLNNIVKEARTESIVNMGTCNIHIAHNSFLHGMTAFESKCSDFIEAVYYFFHDWPSRNEDFEALQSKHKLPFHKIIKHVPSRWLTIEPAALRLLEQWEALMDYFIELIPNKQKQLRSNAHYSIISSSLKNPLMKAEIYIIASMAKVFTKFTLKFQRTEPLIHLLYLDLWELAQVLARRIFKPSSLKRLSVENVRKLLRENNKEDYIDVKNLVIDSLAKRELENVKDVEKVKFLTSCFKFYKSSLEYLIEKSVLGTCQILKYFRCLHPLVITEEFTASDIVKVSQILPISIPRDIIHDEWKCLQSDIFLPGLKDLSNNINAFWKAIFDIKNVALETKYPNISVVVKAALALSNGSGDIERGFSISGMVLNETNACMSLRTLNAKLNITCGLKMHGNKPGNVPITKELLRMAHCAHGSYKKFLEDQKKKEEEVQQAKKEKENERLEKEKLEEEVRNKKAKIEKMEERLSILQDDDSVKESVTDSLFKEADDRLKKGIESKNLTEINLAHSLLETARKKREEEKVKKGEIDTLRKHVDKRKNSLISDFFNKKTKG